MFHLPLLSRSLFRAANLRTPRNLMLPNGETFWGLKERSFDFRGSQLKDLGLLIVENNIFNLEESLKTFCER